MFNPIIELWNKITGKTVAAYKRGADKGSESFARSQAEKVQDSFGVNDQLQASLSGGDSSSGNTMPATTKSTEAVATGGTRSTHVNIDFKNLVENIVFNGTTSENRQEIERNLAEAMLRVLNMAQSSLG